MDNGVERKRGRPVTIGWGLAFKRPLLVRGLGHPTTVLLFRGCRSKFVSDDRARNQTAPTKDPSHTNAQGVLPEE
ncbi:hypothetical protein JZ751_020874 [Albula glossodonta]|uniref:Uncharacterized protein n=1 Tax=Albula glossodonta TaxID=121402 RepID=A0A8T2PJS7_9TELE|nr:hypothetical protein JZ751_020874 [Albula glossodonta]